MVGQRKDILRVLGSAQMAKDETDPALAVLVSRMEALERNQRLQEAQYQASLEAKDKEYGALLAQMSREKAEAQQALEAALGQLHKVQEAAPQDPEVTARMVEQLKKEATVQSANKKKQFQARLEKMPRGKIYNPLPETVRLSINGVVLYVKPGKNNEIPQCFVEAWEDYVNQKQVAQHFIQTLSGPAKEFNDLSRILVRDKAPTIQDTTSGPQVIYPEARTWSEE